MRAFFTTASCTVVCMMVLGFVGFTTACAPDSSVRPQTPGTTPFSELAILPTLEFANAPQVILAAAKDFRELCLEAEADRVLGRMDPDAGTWLEFALVLDGVFYILPANGYHTPYDKFDSERLELPNAKFYYQLQRREREEYRYRSYFVE